MGLCFTVELHPRVEMSDFNEICQNCRLQTCLYTNDEKAIANQDFMEWQPCHSLVMVFRSLGGIYLGFYQCPVFLSHISNYFKIELKMTQLYNLT